MLQFLFEFPLEEDADKDGLSDSAQSGYIERITEIIAHLLVALSFQFLVSKLFHTQH
jgi:hypothetical protein